ncbi:3-hydroxyacyl-CoA dehydrogenase [Paracoccus sp. S-4012]|uniref:3-hydroxyacyl-CoA dehydrogenase NAD-binding domain-containing protein n=1 Tax=Paracoccus sp. S-4012 TaxID=2665648 RepID=UPI0012AFECE8|nr:3-hydroxyacyl-CoA dehydrogenase NAD-binding domain-containing protein [Paracoccus sp. S-4012]MRX49006.1 3-hydroxyacyl-CoA dehydrogenase [Paracoccus sp. S-4012]
MERFSEAVTGEMVGEVALICIDNPPVNAAGHEVRKGLTAAVSWLAGSGAKAAGLWCAGRTFTAGADVREFGKTPQPPSLPEVCNTLEASAVPIVAVMHGTALGGGFELALACHARIGLSGLRVGFPEVNLGILPGAGGTQRGPRLAGIAPVLDMALSGKPMPAEEALKHGLIDELTRGEPREVALDAARRAAAGDLKTRRTGELETPADTDAINAAQVKLAKKPGLNAPPRIVEAVAASTRPITEGLAEERRLFMECYDDPQRAALVHAFLAERAVAKYPEAGAKPRAVKRVGVIGAGTMGQGIATSCLLAGLDVTLVEVKEEALGRGEAAIAKNLDGAMERGKMTAAARAEAEAALDATTDMEALADADLIIEAAFEKMEVKREIFTALDRIAKPGAVLATNTSYLDVNEIAAVTSRPEDVIGLHFFSPAHIMRLLEIVVADRTAPEVVATGFALAKRLGKIGVRAGVCDGFIGNRILGNYARAAEHLVLDGAAPSQVDRAVRGLGMAMGPFEMADLAGLDIGYFNRRRRDPIRPPEERYSKVADRLVEAGTLGRKTGKGYYVYGESKPVPNPDLDGIVADERALSGIAPREFSDHDIRDRYLTAMIAEAARVVEDGIAQRPSDVDAVFLNGYGFPRHLGGPLHQADVIGAAELVRRMEEWSAEDPWQWRVPAILRRMADEGGTFAQLNG